MERSGLEWSVMEKPKCRLCGGRHWSGDAHEFEKASTVLEVAKGKRGKKGVLGASKVKVERKAGKVESVSVGTLQTRAWRAENRSKYNEYQREYMRKRRHGG
jgi:hypothetical protein